jgi:hypothetical protein
MYMLHMLKSVKADIKNEISLIIQYKIFILNFYAILININQITFFDSVNFGLGH